MRVYIHIDMYIVTCVYIYCIYTKNIHNVGCTIEKCMQYRQIIFKESQNIPVLAIYVF